MSHEALLTTVGTRVRSLRGEKGWSRRHLSEQCGVSERYLAQLENGKGNISLTRFADVAQALETTPADLLAGAGLEAPGSGVIALLGVRGAGKSTVGRLVAKHAGVELVELDKRIEDAAGLDLAQIFELHGEAYYRRLEREVLSRLLATGKSMVLATGGSIVSDADNFALLRDRTRTVWLKARAEDHWNRVIEQGDRRPMAENPHAFAELKALLGARASLYARADQVVDTSGKTPDDVAEQVVHSIDI